MDETEKMVTKESTVLQVKCIDAIVEQFCDDAGFVPELPSGCPEHVYNTLLRRLSDPTVAALRGALTTA